MNVEIENNGQPFSIKIDKEGVWYYNGAEMFRKDIVNLFYECLKLNESGRYILELGNDWCFIEVEDVPFVVKAVYKSGSKGEGNETLEIFINDGTSEILDLTSLYIGKDNVPYCRVKNCAFEARFTRAAYYQIADYIDHDDKTNSYFIELNGRNYIL